MVLTGKAKNLNDKFYLILNELVKTYPSTKLRSTVEFDQNMAQMLNLENEYFIYKNEVVSASETIQKQNTITDEKINVYERQNKVLRLKLDHLKTSSYSAEGLFDDAQITRNELLVSNFILFAAISGSCFMYYKSMSRNLA
jgi:hypothetical protein